MTDIGIRAATIDDLAYITALINHYIVHTAITFDVDAYTTEQRVPWFHEHNDGKRYRMLVAEVAGEIVGYCASGAFRPKPAYATSVEVSIACTPSFAGRGVGTLLYEELFRLLAVEDVHCAIAAIVPPNEASVKLHRRFGFEEVGVMKQCGRKFGRYWDVLWMQKRMR